MSEAVCSLERRQDYQDCAPQDWLRHWHESENKQDKQLLLAAAANRHLQAGLCCLPSCLLWLYALNTAKKALKIWAAQPESEEPWSTEPNPELGEYTLGEWEYWLQGQREAAAEGAARPGGASSSASMSPESPGRYR